MSQITPSRCVLKARAKKRAGRLSLTPSGGPVQCGPRGQREAAAASEDANTSAGDDDLVTDEVQPSDT